MRARKPEINLGINYEAWILEEVRRGRDEDDVLHQLFLKFLNTLKERSRKVIFFDKTNASFMDDKIVANELVKLEKDKPGKYTDNIIKLLNFLTKTEKKVILNALELLKLLSTYFSFYPHLRFKMHDALSSRMTAKEVWKGKLTSYKSKYIGVEKCIFAMKHIQGEHSSSGFIWRIHAINNQAVFNIEDILELLNRVFPDNIQKNPEFDLNLKANLVSHAELMQELDLNHFIHMYSEEQRIEIRKKMIPNYIMAFTQIMPKRNRDTKENELTREYELIHLLSKMHSCMAYLKNEEKLLLQYFSEQCTQFYGFSFWDAEKQQLLPELKRYFFEKVLDCINENTLSVEDGSELLMKIILWMESIENESKQIFLSILLKQIYKPVVAKLQILKEFKRDSQIVAGYLYVSQEGNSIIFRYRDDSKAVCAREAPLNLVREAYAAYGAHLKIDRPTFNLNSSGDNDLLLLRSVALMSKIAIDNHQYIESMNLCLLYFDQFEYDAQRQIANLLIEYIELISSKNNFVPNMQNLNFDHDGMIKVLDSNQLKSYTQLILNLFVQLTEQDVMEPITDDLIKKIAKGLFGSFKVAEDSVKKIMFNTLNMTFVSRLHQYEIKNQKHEVNWMRYTLSSRLLAHLLSFDKKIISDEVRKNYLTLFYNAYECLRVLPDSGNAPFSMLDFSFLMQNIHYLSQQEQNRIIKDYVKMLQSETRQKMSLHNIAWVSLTMPSQSMESDGLNQLARMTCETLVNYLFCDWLNESNFHHPDEGKLCQYRPKQAELIQTFEFYFKQLSLSQMVNILSRFSDSSMFKNTPNDFELSYDYKLNTQMIRFFMLFNTSFRIYQDKTNLEALKPILEKEGVELPRLVARAYY